MYNYISSSEHDALNDNYWQKNLHLQLKDVINVKMSKMIDMSNFFSLTIKVRNAQMHKPFPSFKCTNVIGNHHKNHHLRKKNYLLLPYHSH